MSEEAQKTEEELLAEWENMADAEESAAVAGEEAEGEEVVPERVLDQGEIDSLLGIDGDDDGPTTGVKALLDQNVVNYEKLPMLEVIYDKFERFLSTSLRHFTADNVDVTITNMTSVRFGDYLNSIPLPAGLVVVNAAGLDDYILMVYESQLIYTVVDVLLGGRRAQPARVEGRNFTTIERRIMDNLTDVVLTDLSEAFTPVAPVQFKYERMEVNPRFAVISQETNVSILVSVRISLEGREGTMHFCLPYATLEPIREQLLQQFMGEKFGQDNIWENHLSQELYHTHVPVAAVMDEMVFQLSDVLKWQVGDTITFDARPESPVRLDCGNVFKMMGAMGRAKDYKAVRVTETITDINNQQDRNS
ncbi:MAG: flagellar motor switch protein FliM [Alphaproteobacteria bacterium]|nr:flagellar motor switch protein FliM [Alphaproteobacteria bacterium]MDD9919327.1 flagellar motor switch protein FliM [Alphaproteobacteria bacterium]